MNGADKPSRLAAAAGTMAAGGRDRENIELPACEIDREDPSHPPVGRRLKFFALRMAGRVASALRRFRSGGAIDQFGILTYHRVAPVISGFAPPMHNVPPEPFYNQLAGLKREGFNFLSLQDVLAARRGARSLPPRAVVVTFDDGFESVHEYAWPALRELQIPATIFVNTGYLDSSHPFPFDAWGQAYCGKVPPVTYRPLTTAQCQTLASAGLIDLGAHTHSHADFRGRADLFRLDMEVCLSRLRSRLGIERPTFAFPFGGPHLGFADEALVEVVRELGLACALTTRQSCVNLSESPFYWGRINAFDWDTHATLAGKLLGLYSWAPRLAQSVTRALHAGQRRTSSDSASEVQRSA